MNRVHPVIFASGIAIGRWLEGGPSVLLPASVGIFLFAFWLARDAR